MPAAFDGDGLQSVVWKNRRSGVEEQQSIRHVFLFIGADPNTDWLKDCPIYVDNNGFVCTGPTAQKTMPEVPPGTPEERLLMPNETTQHGVFAVGDVRAGSVKRVASAVGEGSVGFPQLHAYLAESRAV